jgi:hypothetical protein
MKGKILHFANSKVLDLSNDEAQYFLDVTETRAISGYGTSSSTLTSSVLDTLFFSLFEEQDDPVAIVNELFEKQYAANCLILDYIIHN